jgi:hypothetical protein
MTGSGRRFWLNTAGLSGSTVLGVTQLGFSLLKAAGVPWWPNMAITPVWAVGWFLFHRWMTGGTRDERSEIAPVSNVPVI